MQSYNNFNPIANNLIILKYALAAPDANKELDSAIPPIIIDPTQFKGSLHHGKDEKDSNCWTAPSGEGFMIRGKNYLKDNSKVNILSFHFEQHPDFIFGS